MTDLPFFSAGEEEKTMGGLRLHTGVQKWMGQHS
jgi:hypothetical protein